MRPPIASTWIAGLLVATSCAGNVASSRSPAVERPPSSRRPTRRSVVVLPAGYAGPSFDTSRSVRVVRARSSAADVYAAAEPLLERARTAYRDLAFEDALEAVGEAQLLLEAHAHTERDFDALTQALLYRGMAELALGHAERARDALRTVVILRPSLVLDEGRFAPEVRAMHEEMLAAVRTDPPSALTVTTEPANATISLDGRVLGRAPRTVQGSSGRHYVEVSALGHETRLLSVVLAPGGSPALHVELPLDRPASVAATLTRTEPAALRLSRTERVSIRAALDAEELVLVSRCRRVCARAIDLPSGRSRDLSAASAGGLLRAITSLPAEGDDAEPRRSARARYEGDAWWVSPWPWVVLGAVVVGAGAATAIVLSSDTPETRIVLTPQP